MPSWREFRKVAYQGGLYEAQDVLEEIDKVDLICPKATPYYRICEKWQRRLMWRDRTKLISSINPGLQPVRLDRKYDLFVAVCQNYWDLLSLNAIKGWQKACRTSVVWFDEAWAAWMPFYKNWLHLFNRFDHIVFGLSGTIKTAEAVLKRKCHWVPYGVDAIRFSPFPNPPARVIDVYSIGRRREAVHQLLMKKSSSRSIFYVYDTVRVNDAELPDYRNHRDLYANIAKRSRFFLVAPAKMDDPHATHGQVEISSRYFEGSAAGAVLLGESVESDSFRELFDWKDAVVPIKPCGEDLEEVLTLFAREPTRLHTISRRNSVGALLRHDWAYRWKQILSIAGLETQPRMAARERRLRELANMAESSEV